MINQEESISMSLNKGKKLLHVVIFISLFGELVYSPLIGAFDFTRLLITLVLVYFVYKGHNWARILMGTLFGLSGILGINTLLNLEPNFSGFLVLFVIMEIFYFVGMSILLFSKNAISFLKHRRESMK